MKLEKYKGFFVRPDTLDAYIVNELNGYKILPITKHDRVLDVGGCIGTFAKYAAESCALVWTFEPMPDNFEVLLKNVEGLTNVKSHPMAVVLGDEQSVAFYVNMGKNKGAHTTIPTRGRETIYVRTMKWRKIMSTLKPTKIKMDCEGAEYSLLSEPLNQHVRGLVMEYHLQKKDQREKSLIVHESLIYQGFQCIRMPILNTKAWTAFACYTR